MPLWQRCLLLFVVLVQAFSLHLKGTFTNKDFYKFLVKFGFQKVNLLDRRNTRGYIYGTLKPTPTVHNHPDYDLYLVVVTSDYFIKLQAHKDLAESNPNRCSLMFEKINEVAWDAFCPAKNPVEDFLRRIPCPANGSLCLEERGMPGAVMSGSQFTYVIDDTTQPWFWYISLTSCHRERKTQACSLTFNSSVEVSVDYDIWFVNGHPENKHLNPFEHQFSYELHDVWEIYILGIVLNGFLLIIQLIFVNRQKHLLIYMITAIIILEVCGQLFNIIHYSIFAANGVGAPILTVLGNFIDLCAHCVMVLELLIIVKGYAITTPKLNNKYLILTIWGIYSGIYLTLFIFNLLAVEPLVDRNEWVTVPGYCIIAFRLIVMIYFLYELQKTARRADDDKKDFFIRFGAGYLVWFIYLPITALISPKIAPLWRFKTLLSIQTGADFIFTIILVHLFWPSEDRSYFNIPQKRRSSRTARRKDRQRLIVPESSSEDELYERQTRLTRKGYSEFSSNHHGMNGITTIKTTPL